METNSERLPRRPRFLIGTIAHDWELEKPKIYTEYTEYLNQCEKFDRYKSYGMMDYHIVVLSDLFGTTLYLN